HQYAPVARAVIDFFRQRRCRFLRLTVAHQFDAEEQPYAAHVADDFITRLHFAKALHQVVTDFAGVLAQAIALDHIEYGKAGRAGNEIAAERVEILEPVVERGSDLARRHQRRHRMAVADRLAHGDDVGHHA